MNKELRRNMDMCVCRMKVAGEIERLNAIKHSLLTGCDEYTIQGLELAIQSLEEAYNLLDRYH